MVRKLALIFLVLFLVGSVWAGTFDPGERPNYGCKIRPLGIYPTYPMPYVCLDAKDAYPENRGLTFMDQSWSFWSNCECTAWNQWKSDNSVCMYDNIDVVHDLRRMWGWDFRNVPEGFIIHQTFGEQLNGKACNNCIGPGVIVYDEIYTTVQEYPGNAFPGQNPVEITYLRCDTSNFAADGNQKAYDTAYGKYDLIYGIYRSGNYQCGYAPYPWPKSVEDKPHVTQEIPIVGIITRALDPNSQFRRANANLNSEQPLIKSFISTAYAGQACNANPTCPSPGSTICPGDFNGDNKVDAADLAYLTEFWMRADCSPENGCCGGADVAKCPGETGNTGRVDACDLAVISENFGKTCTGQPPEVGRDDGRRRGIQFW